jgi:hypothetical protein
MFKNTTWTFSGMSMPVPTLEELLVPAIGARLALC